jgi:3-oxoacyl-[acyl-carrier protein] reductase
MIILTGASGGIGSKIITKLAGLDKVIALYHSNIPEIEKNSNVIFEQIDLLSEKNLIDFSSFTSKKYNKFTLIHAATISSDSLVASTSLESWKESLDINLNAVFILNREFIKHMMNEKWGRIIHFSSVASSKGVPGTVAYAASKSALTGMSRVIAREYARFNITSNIISLGYFDSGLINTLSDSMKTNIINEIPSKKLGDPDEIVNAIDFFMKTSYANGSILSIDGAI